MNRTHLLLFACGTALPLATAHADTFGTGADTFTIDFVTIGNLDNGNDLNGANQYPAYGKVRYEYRMGVYEISQSQIDAAVAGGLAHVTAGAWQGARPAANMTWYEAAAFVNWLNASTGHQPAYNLTWTGTAWTMAFWSDSEEWEIGGPDNPFRHRNARYFIPNEDEWYKAAYHRNDGVTANYWDFATGTDAFPNGIDFAGDLTYDVVCSMSTYNVTQPMAVTAAGDPSSYGTIGQTGNVQEWTERTAFFASPHPAGSRVTRGGYYGNYSQQVDSQDQLTQQPQMGTTNVGFRVASIPEPSSALLLASAFPLLLRRRRHLRP